MEVVLVVLCNFQEYIFDNINNLQKFNNNNITVICDKQFVHLFVDYHVKIVETESLIPEYTGTVSKFVQFPYTNSILLLVSYNFI